MYPPNILAMLRKKETPAQEISRLIGSVRRAACEVCNKTLPCYVGGNDGYERILCVKCYDVKHVEYCDKRDEIRWEWERNNGIK